jgi:hypothetical protein
LIQLTHCHRALSPLRRAAASKEALTGLAFHQKVV